MENKKSYDGEQPDIYGKMYQDRLEKFNSMANDGTDDTEDTLRFYSEEELEAIDRAKRDAAQQAYEDAYRREYEKSSRMYREQLENGQSVRSGNNAGERLQR
jgi:hypothetical protein